MADCRYRGQCNEGAESQQAMLETIDFSPKIGLNVYMLEFDVPKIYYDWYYDHKYNSRREPEPVSALTEQLEQDLAGHRNMPFRVQTVAVRLLTEHAAFCRGLSAALALKCVGKGREAKQAFRDFMDTFGGREAAMERYYDHFMAVNALRAVFSTKSEYDQ